MSHEETARITVFLALVASVYAAAALLTLRLVIQRRFGRAPHRGERGVRLAVFGLALLGFGCAGYAAWVEPRWLATERVTVTSPRWRGAPLRIVHISDLHSEEVVGLEAKLPAVIGAEHPDLIVFTGDSLNTPAGLPTFKRCMSELARIAPVVAVRGNWDVWYWSALDLFEGTGALELTSSSVVLPIRGNQVWIGGLSVEREGALRDLVGAAPSGALRVLLHHYPDEVVNAAAVGVDLYLAGHTHGGQIALPFYGALVTLSKFGKRFESGLSRVGATWEYTNRGIGMEGGSAPRVRFAARPEVTVIEVIGEPRRAEPQ
jgi:predicted MPP superfamily phosphohydrolase